LKTLRWLLVLAPCALVTSSARTDPPILGSTAISWEEIQAKPASGRSRQVFRAPTATLDELELHVTTLPVGDSPHAPHKHPDEEVIIIKEGTVEAMVNGQTRRLGPGSVIFQAADQMHGIRNAGDVPAVYHVIKWKTSLTKGALRRAPLNPARYAGVNPAPRAAR
jgi:XRE family transcriptional regulator, regulator of sulfur utilization